MSQQEIKEIFDYKDGFLYWKIDKANKKIKAGSVAGSKTSKGYFRLTLNYQEIPVHKIIYLWNKGFVPNVIDHIDGDKLNNKIENLRSANLQTNQYNRKKGKNNSSGCKNVFWNAKGKYWQVHIRENKKVHSWYVKDFELAELIATEARNKYHKEFANHV